MLVYKSGNEQRNTMGTKNVDPSQIRINPALARRRDEVEFAKQIEQHQRIEKIVSSATDHARKVCMRQPPLTRHVAIDIINAYRYAEPRFDSVAGKKISRTAAAISEVMDTIPSELVIDENMEAIDRGISKARKCLEAANGKFKQK